MFEVIESGLSDSEYRVFEPKNTNLVELPVEECFPKLTCEHRELLNHLKFQAPVLLVGKFLE